MQQKFEQQLRSLQEEYYCLLDIRSRLGDLTSTSLIIRIGELRSKINKMKMLVNSSRLFPAIENF